MGQRPTLYIKQSKVSLPYAPMQEEYHSMGQSSNEPSGKQTNQDSGTQLLTGQSIKNTPQRFDEMTMEEKVDYLLPTSKNLPAIHCKLTINQMYYRGRILKREEDQFVFEERQSRKRHLFDLREITDLRMIGF